MDMGEKTVSSIEKVEFMKMLAEDHELHHNPDGSMSFVFKDCVIIRFTSETGAELYFKQEVIQ